MIVLFWGIFPAAYGQEIEYGREINEFNGLTSNVSRNTFVDESGSVWVGTDAGLNVFPKTNSVYQNICNKVSSSQVWSISQLSKYLYVATYDSGLYQFDLLQGQMINHWSYEEMPRIRRIRKINEELYVVHAKGINRINSQIINQNIIPFPLTGMAKNDFPMDIFTINGELHVSYYISHLIFKKFSDEIWHPVKLFPETNDSLNKRTVLCAKEINGITYLGIFPNKYAIYHNGKSEIYTFKSDRRKALAIWDIDGEKDNIYFALGNNLDLRDGYFWKHKPNESKEIRLNILDKRQYSWSVYVDPFYNGVWYSTVTNGVYFQPHREKWIDIPQGYHDFKITQNYIVAWNSFFVFIRNKGNFQWRIIPINSSILDLIEVEKSLYIVNNYELLKINPDKSEEFEIIAKENYQNIIRHENKLYLFRLVGMVDYFDLKRQRLIKNQNPELKNVIRFAANHNKLLLQIENQGYILVENHNAIHLKTNLPSDITKNKFFFCGQYLITQTGKEIQISTLNSIKKEIKTRNKINISELFKNINIEWIAAADKSLLMGNSTTAFLFEINPVNFDLIYNRQFYLGASPLNFETTQTDIDFIYKKGKGEIMVIPTSPNNSMDFHLRLKAQLIGTKMNFNTLITRSWEGQSLIFKGLTNHFLFEKYGKLPFEIWDIRKCLEKKFIPVNTPYILELFPHGVYNIHIGNNNAQSQNILLRINQSIFYNVGFWIIFILVILLIGYIIFQYQREKLSLNQKIISLQLSTLKANLNPHFIFNIMNLIQSLIIKSEKSKALKATSDLAMLNRLFLETSNKDLITITEELEYAKKYIDLEKMRFEEDTTINFDMIIDSEINTNEWYLPPLILQPLLENALKHGYYKNNASETHIQLEIQYLQKFQLQICVTNPISNRSHKNRGTNLGISLVKDRISLLNERYNFDYKADFNIKTTGNSFYSAIIIIEKRNLAWMYTNNSA